MVDTAPGKVGDVDETVNTAEIHEHAVVGDVLDDSFKDLALLELADEFSPLGLLLGLEQSFVGNDHVAILVVDLDNLEVDGLVDILVVVTDRLDVDLAAGEECLDAEHVHDHTALGAGLHETLHDLVLLERFVYPIPRLEGTGFLVRKDNLSLLVFGRLDEDLHLVTDLQVRIVAELGGHDHAFALAAHGDDDLALVDGGDFAFLGLAAVYAGESLVVSLFDFLLVGCAVNVAAFLKGVPVELFGSH